MGLKVNMTKTKKRLDSKITKAIYRPKRVRRKKEIMHIAAQLFSEKGYHDVTMDEIAERVGVAKGTIYLYFKSKENLYLEILEDRYKAIESLLEKEIAKSDTAPKKLRKVLKIIFGFYRQNLDVLRILSRDETHLIREHYEFTEHWRLRRVKLYEKILEKGLKEHSFRPINIKLAALIIFGLVRSVMFFYETENKNSEEALVSSQAWFLNLNYEADKTAEELVEDVFSVIARGILANGEEGTKGIELKSNIEIHPG